MNDIKQELIDRFSSEASCGIYYEDIVSGENKEDVDPALHDSDDYEFYAYLPDGEEMGRCTNCANWIKSLYGKRADVYGFMVEDNPNCSSRILNIVGGHDFAVIDQRYIVDIWISLYSNEEQQVIFDLCDQADNEKIRTIYGNPKCWSYLDDVFIAPSSKDYPISKKISLATNSEPSLSI
ncbi:hypothetical protein [Vibrio owensii]|uniref:hypothetical protein n=1 Tax=Vibrio owensii TaxID=696485 RepID=UPI003CC531CA